MAKEKPGVMMYWETFDVLESLVDGDAKLMVSAIRQYAQYGALPDFNGNNLLSTLWILIRPKLDADSERYERIREQRRGAVNARWKKERQWTATDEYGSIQPYSNDTDEYGSIRNIPTTSTTTTPTAEAETPATPISDTEKGIMDHVYRDNGRPLTSPPECSNIENSNFEKLRQQKIKELQSTFERR